MDKPSTMGNLGYLLLAGGAGLALYLMTRKSTATTAPATQPGTNMVIQPTGGWGYPPMTPAIFSSWCKANNGLQTGGTCLISNKGAYTLSNSRLKQGGSWVLTDEDLF